MRLFARRIPSRLRQALLCKHVVIWLGVTGRRGFRK
jgi:hypothetical protein